jgi:leader peptidase (prepilin peptidase) / N-methyltransferase
MFFVSVLTVLARIDLRERILPNRIVVPAAAIVAVAQSVIFPDRAVEWIGAAALASLVLLLPLLVYPSGMGMGDVKLGLLLGAGLGLPVISAIALGFVLVLPVALFLIARGGASARKTAIPFGPFLAAGAVIVLFGGALH